MLQKNNEPLWFEILVNQNFKALAKKDNQVQGRVNFASVVQALDYPDFLDVQLESFREFFQLETTSDNRHSEGLFKVFSENFPITDCTKQSCYWEFFLTIDVSKHDIVHVCCKLNPRSFERNYSCRI